MSRTKIDYGIDLGTTNSAISRMENGEAVIKKTDTLKDTMPSCIFFNKKQAVQAGDSAYNSLKRDKLNAMKDWSDNTNAFIEFKRTMGTDKTYFSQNLNRSLSSEELSAEVLKALKSFIKDENVNAAIITVPAAFKNNQIDATRRAAKMAGFNHVEVLQEPVAAALAYGVDTKDRQDGFWLVFDFGGGTFDAALLKSEDGIMKVTDTEGDNYLGGKNLDLAIVDEIIMPYLMENYALDSMLEDDECRQILRNAMKFYAEEAKIQLSFNQTHNILSDLGDIPAEDDNGEELELDITVTQSDIERALSPVFQRAIDICKVLLKRNNLNGSQLTSLILVGGPTYSPVLRKMLEQQICKPDTSVEPMTVVSKGAALYASTVDLNEEIKEQTRDRSKIQLTLGYESTSVESEEFVMIKVLKEKTEGSLPETLFAEITRGDKAWSSGKVEINELGEVIEVQLLEGKNNNFLITLYDQNGNLMDCEPNHFNILQGVGGVSSMQVLPYNYGIEIHQRSSGRDVFSQIQGLERNKSLPVTGIRNGLKTQQQIRPGVVTDFIKIPLYQGEHNADGTRAIYNEHVYDVIISGNDLPALLPENSDVDLTIQIDKSQKISISAYFPYLDYTAEIAVPEIRQNIETVWLEEQFRQAENSLEELKEQQVHQGKVNQLEKRIIDLQSQFENNSNDVDNKQQVLTNLRKELKQIDDLTTESEWPTMQQELDNLFDKLEKSCNEKGNNKAQAKLNEFKQRLNEICRLQDMKLAKALLDEMQKIEMELNRDDYIKAIFAYWYQNFDELHWLDKYRAKQLIEQAIQYVIQDNLDEALPLFGEIIHLLPQDERPNTGKGNSNILVG